MDCNRAEELFGPYILGALDSTQRGAMESHLETCDACSFFQPSSISPRRSSDAPAILMRPSMPTSSTLRPASLIDSRKRPIASSPSALGPNCGNQPSARRAARWTAAPAIAPIQIGMGRWTGRGLMPTCEAV